jgi:hypothetical protein
LALLAALVALLWWRAPRDTRMFGGFDESGGGRPDAGGTPSAEPRCEALAGAYRVGTIGEAVEPGQLVPFAVELGRGTRHGEGFAVGVKRHKDGGVYASVALVDAEARKGELVDLGRSRGDVDPPQVVARGNELVAGVLEPQASSMALRLARYDGKKLHWGSELEQGRDESLAFDMAFSDSAGVVAWDDVVDDGERGAVVLAQLDGELASRGKPSAVSPEHLDADVPRVLVRPGGFWLVYVARSRGERGEGGGVPGRYAAEARRPADRGLARRRHAFGGAWRRATNRGHR